MLNISPVEILVIGLLALVLFGPHRLPELARKAGRIARELQRATDEFKRGLKEEYRELSEPMRELSQDVVEQLDTDSDDRGGPDDGGERPQQ